MLSGQYRVREGGIRPATVLAALNEQLDGVERFGRKAVPAAIALGCLTLSPLGARGGQATPQEH
jgi:hypothetical protein